VRTPGPADFAQIRAALSAEHIPEQGVQQFGDPSEVLIRLGAQPTEAAVQQAVTRVRTALEKSVSGVKVLRTDAVGASVSAELFRNGLLALGISLLMILVYIWFRFEWLFAVGAVVTLILDITKAIGFLAVTRIEFDLVMVAAILTILGYSTNDKVVVYDRVRENLRKYKTLPLRDLIDLSINETLNRTLGTSMTVFLASLPLALFGGQSISGFAWVMLFGIVVGTSSSIFIAAPILLFLGENRLRREAAPAAAPTAPDRRHRAGDCADCPSLRDRDPAGGRQAGLGHGWAGPRFRLLPWPASAFDGYHGQQLPRRGGLGGDAGAGPGGTDRSHTRLGRHPGTAGAHGGPRGRRPLAADHAVGGGGEGTHRDRFPGGHTACLRPGHHRPCGG
jgi:preprotein translocase subunit SecD/preprotein translocase subunit SecF